LKNDTNETNLTEADVEDINIDTTDNLNKDPLTNKLLSSKTLKPPASNFLTNLKRRFTTAIESMKMYLDFNQESIENFEYIRLIGFIAFF